jgi:hypothetical protein
MSETSSCEELQRKRFQDLSPFECVNPLNIVDRARAIKEEFTSVARDCPYYTETVRSKCLVDPHVIFMPECDGRSFSRGVCCPKIIQSSVDCK